jgi:hypothetical protein
VRLLDDEDLARCGVLVVAYGEPARACADRLLASVRRHMPGLAVCAVSDVPLGREDVWREYPDLDLGGRRAKTCMDELAPTAWEVVLYLDADTELLGRVDGALGPLLDGWDAVACPNPPRWARLADAGRPDNADELRETAALFGTTEILQLNGGVFGYRRSPATAALLRAWHAEWDRYGKRDQAALLRALHRCPVRLWLLSDEYNRLVRYRDPSARTVIAHHTGQARRLTGLYPGRLDDPELRRSWEAARWASTTPA